MKIKSVSFENMIKVVRDCLIEQTGLSSEKILNAVSVRGPDIKVLIDEYIVGSPNLNSNFIIFEVTVENNTPYGAIEKTDTTMEVLTTYNFHLKIYGNTSLSLGQQILARFKSSEVASSLRDLGVYINGISGLQTIHEFINNTVWPRCDLSLEVQTITDMSKQIQTEYTESYSDIQIKGV